MGWISAKKINIPDLLAKQLAKVEMKKGNKRKMTEGGCWRQFVCIWVNRMHCILSIKLNNTKLSCSPKEDWNESQFKVHFPFPLDQKNCNKVSTVKCCNSKQKCKSCAEFLTLEIFLVRRMKKNDNFIKAWLKISGELTLFGLWKLLEDQDRPLQLNAVALKLS